MGKYVEKGKGTNNSGFRFQGVAGGNLAAIWNHNHVIPRAQGGYMRRWVQCFSPSTVGLGMPVLRVFVLYMHGFLNPLLCLFGPLTFLGRLMCSTKFLRRVPGKDIFQHLAP